MKKHRTLAEAHEAVRHLRDRLCIDPRTLEAYEKAVPPEKRFLQHDRNREGSKNAS